MYVRDHLVQTTLRTSVLVTIPAESSVNDLANLNVDYRIFMYLSALSAPLREISTVEIAENNC